MPRLRRMVAVLTGVGLALLAGCTTVDGNVSPPSDSGAPPAGTPYVSLTRAVVAHGGHAWVDTDLVKAWRGGPSRYASVLDTVSYLASLPGVDGVKIADELGYDDGMSVAETDRFLARASADLHSRVPGTSVLVDMIVPALGCLDWPGSNPTTRMTTCADAEDSANPATSIAALDGYIKAGNIDVLDLSVGLRPDSEYSSWGLARDDAMSAAWREAMRRWGGSVTLLARKALAHPGGYTGTTADAERDVHTFVDIPMEHGAAGVDVWTWSQPYKDTTYQLTDPGLAGNALMTALHTRAERGVKLWTNMTPSSLQRGVESDVAAALTTFGTILVAAGTG